MLMGLLSPAPPPTDRAGCGHGSGRPGGSRRVRSRPGDAVAAVAQVEPAVVRIDTAVEYQGPIGTGTGIVLDPGGQVLTNFHVIQGADRVTAMRREAAPTRPIWSVTTVNATSR